MFSSARLALRRSPAAAASRAASTGVGLRRRQDTEAPSPQRRLLHYQLRPRRLFNSSAASGSDETSHQNMEQHSPGIEVEADPDLEMEYGRRHGEKRKELIHLLANAVDTCDPAHRDRVMEKRKELIHLLAEAVVTCDPAHRDRVMAKCREMQQLRQEFLANKARTNHGATRSKKTPDGEKSMSFGDHSSFFVFTGGVILGSSMSELLSRL